MKKYDVAICGYGPVGSVCSLLLAQYGLNVLVIDKNNGPSLTARAINTDAEQLRVFDKFNSNLKKGDRVITKSGIHAKIAALNDKDNTCVIETLAGKIKIERSALSIEMSQKLNNTNK